jgi:D-alanyl-lipoteichoic acid acyltransferase DltB (MBOAT superfamily)
MLDFDSFEYFEDLLALGLLLVPLFYVLPSARARRILLGLAGMYLVFLIAPRLLAFYLPFWVGLFALQHLIAAAPARRWRPAALALSIAATLTPLVLWKIFPTRFVVRFNVFFDERVDDVFPWLGAVDRIRDIILPIGLSFATFRAIDLLVKVHLEIIEPLTPTRMLAYGFFPPVQVIGPVIEYSEIETGLDDRRRADPADILAGVLLVAVGLIKVFVISYLLEPSGEILVRFDEATWWETWIELFLFALYFFFNFAGFSDIAIGAARLFGFRLKPNFNNPYMKTTPQEFWNNWHMSLTRFAQRNVFVPLGGMRRQHQYRAIFATIMVIALWHDLTVPLVLFGFYHAAGLIGHRILIQRRAAAPDPTWAVQAAKMGLVFGFVALSFPMLLLRLADLPDFYGRLIGVS